MYYLNNNYRFWLCAPLVKFCRKNTVDTIVYTCEALVKLRQTGSKRTRVKRFQLSI